MASAKMDCGHSHGILERRLMVHVGRTLHELYEIKKEMTLI